MRPGRRNRPSAEVVSPLVALGGSSPAIRSLSTTTSSASTVPVRTSSTRPPAIRTTYASWSVQPGEEVVLGQPRRGAPMDEPLGAERLPEHLGREGQEH